MTILFITHFLALGIGAALGFIAMGICATAKDADGYECTDFNGET